MYLKKINLINFKNIEAADIEFSSNVNCFTGENGAGKTNVLDAIHFLSLCKSSGGMSDSGCVRHGEGFFMAEGEYEISNDTIEQITCSYSSSAGKVIKRNGKEYSRLSAHIGLLPLVMVCPADTSLINDASEERRRFLNSFISQIDNDYLNNLLKYNGVLSQRNKLLKELHSTSQYEILDILDMQLAEVASNIYKKRCDYIDTLAPIVSDYYREISDDREPVSMSYRSALKDASLEQLLFNARDKDRIMGHTTVGIHRDNLDFKIADYPIRKYGSQGQQKSFLIALKLAQFDVIASKRHIRPTLLLDDIFDKLDLGRVERLIKLVSDDRFGQIFITDANKVRVDTILTELKQQHSLFKVTEGVIEKI